ncbi:hypothetical protein ASG89_00320 [Paenibacillus sp. Soil766]|nr:hypothetical protein ASG89_00320 [Paenibacillus sp. Soil766]
MEKVERLLSIVMILLKKDIVSTKEFAQLFNVSKRTILRDMETLSLSNIPIYSVHGSYVEDFRDYLNKMVEMYTSKARMASI